MPGIFKWIGAGFKGIGKAIALPFLKVRASSRLQLILRWTFHVFCVGLILAGLWFLNFALRLDTVLLTPYPALRSSWLPLVFVQLYAMSWIGWWLCKLLTSRQTIGEHPDLDKAWRQAETALHRANIDLRATPLFLFLGKPSHKTASFFNAGHVVRTVAQVPVEDDAAFHVYASDEGVYLCCEDTSLLGRQSVMFTEAEQRRSEQQWHPDSNARSRRPTPQSPVSVDRIPVQSEPASTLDAPPISRPTPEPALVGAIATTTPNAGGALQPASPSSADRSLALLDSKIALMEELKAEPEIMVEEETRLYQPAPKINLPLLQNEAEIETTLSRLKYLCQIIEEARHPYCPINGVVVLVPYSASESDEVANHTGALIEQDLEAIAEATQVDAPRIAVICDIQEIPGCVELLDRFPEEQRHRRLGIRFPKIPSCEREKMSQMIFQGLQWLCQKMVPPLVNRLFQTERTGGGAEEAVNEANRRLYRFMYSLRERQGKLERIIRRAFLGNGRKDELLRGCYLSATGKDTLSEQGFTAGIFSQIFDMQNDVSWTKEALERDQDFRRWSVLGYSSVATIAIVAILMILL